jgi:lysophospholipase L1-like esterase
MLTTPSGHRSEPDRPCESNPTEPLVARRPIAVFALTLLLLLLIEAILQARTQLRHGYGFLDLMQQQRMYLVDSRTGLKLFRPNGVFVRNQQFFRSNSLGLRGPELSHSQNPNRLRIVLLGASTVMGFTASDNEHTSSYLLESKLRHRLLGIEVEVVNGGISGYALADEQALLEKVLAPLGPDLVVLYPGFNDFASYCRPPSRRQPPPLRGLPTLEMPEWWMTDDLVLKNTEGLRSAPPALVGTKDPDTMNLSSYRAQVASLIRSAQSREESLVVATVARNFRREQPTALQQTLSAEIRSSLPCFTLDGMHRLFDRHNDILKAEAAIASVPVIELDKLIPGGSRYFSNTTHFTEEGEEVAAEAMATFIQGLGIGQRGFAH